MNIMRNIRISLCVLNNDLLYFLGLAREQVGRSLLQSLFDLKERKVRTPKGSEPANGGAPTQIPDSKFQMRKAGSGIREATTSATENRPATVCFEISD